MTREEIEAMTDEEFSRLLQRRYNTKNAVYYMSIIALVSSIITTIALIVTIVTSHGMWYCAIPIILQIILIAVAFRLNDKEVRACMDDTDTFLRIACGFSAVELVIFIIFGIVAIVAGILFLLMLAGAGGLATTCTICSLFD